MAFSWLINWGVTNHLQVLGAHPPSNNPSLPVIPCAWGSVSVRTPFWQFHPHKADLGGPPMKASLMTTHLTGRCVAGNLRHRKTPWFSVNCHRSSFPKETSKVQLKQSNKNQLNWRCFAKLLDSFAFNWKKRPPTTPRHRGFGIAISNFLEPT